MDVTAWATGRKCAAVTSFRLQSLQFKRRCVERHSVWEKGQARGRDGRRALGGETEEIKQRQKEMEQRRESEEEREKI